MTAQNELDEWQTAVRDQDDLDRLIYALRDLIDRRRLGNRPLPRNFGELYERLSASVYGSEFDSAEPQSEPDELIDAAASAEILHCSDRRVRQIWTDLDGRKIGNRYVFRRQTVVEYGERRKAVEHR